MPADPMDDPNPLRDGVQELMRRWRALIALPLLAAVVGVLLTFVVPKQYEGVAIFSPAEDVSPTLPGNLQSIAAQFGVSAGTKGYNVYYFAQVAQSREVLRLVASDTLEADGQRVPVLALLDVDDTTAQSIEKGIRRLKDKLIVRTDDQADLVTLRTRAPSPATAAALTAAVLEALNTVTTASIRSGGSAERRFAEAQADSAQGALRAAENQHRDFLSANRSIASSPALQFEDARLRRQIQIRQDVFLALTNQAQAAKLREVRNTPSISLIQPPQASPKKVWPRASVWALFSGIGAFTIMAAWIYVLSPLLLPRGRGS
ncbi:MAG: Wzz/FepE/Etk N-terminal domain-containing protein [Deltaproteobacteria bacterium]|nr:Wzz/FepE/Etk N-terminal domain-containing protein [Deltaproteobacteria bacterium]